MTAQTKIDTEVDAMTLLAKLLEFDTGVIWTVMTLADHLRWESARVERSMKWLIDRELATKNLGSYVRTEAGREHYAGAVTKSVIQVSGAAFKNEALTGLKQGITGRTHQDWQRSGIMSGALPRTGGHPKHTETTPEDIYLKSEEATERAKAEKQTAKLLGLTLTEFRKLFEQGAIRLCKLGGDEHVGRFHRKGSGWRHGCVECLRKQRKEKR